MVSLGELATITKGVSYTSAGLDDSGRVLVNLKNVGKGGGFRPEGNKHYSGEVKPSHLLQGGDLLLAYTDLTKAKEILGCPVIVPMSPEYVGACFSMDLGKIEPDPNRLDRAYLAYWLQSQDAREYMKANGSGATVMHLRSAAVPALLVPLPPLDEQKRIVAKLDEVRREFGARERNLSGGKAEGDALWSATVDESLKLDAPFEQLVGLCSVFADGDWIESKDQAPSGFRLVQTGNVGSGAYRSNEARARFVSPEVVSRLRCTEVFPGDILVSRLPDPVGRACIVPDIGERMITAVDCTIVRPGAALLPDFLMYFTQSSRYQRQVRERITGTTRERISRKNLGEILVPVPPVGQQSEVVQRLKAIRTSLELTQSLADRRIDANLNLHDALMSQILNGAA